MQYMKILGIIKERERMERVQKAKDNANTYIFGGKSIYGSLLATACEKFGWTRILCADGGHIRTVEDISAELCALADGIIKTK